MEKAAMQQHQYHHQQSPYAASGQEEEDHHVYQGYPSQSTVHPNSSSGGGVADSMMYDEEEDVDVVTFLQRAGEQYRNHIKMLQHEKKSEELATLRSKPVICRGTDPKVQQITTMDRGIVGDRLHKLWEKRLASEEAMRKKKEDDEYRGYWPKEDEETAQSKHKLKNSGKPHQPWISGKAKAVGPRDQSAVSQDFLEKHKKKIEALRNEALKKELEEVVPNRPQMVSRSRSRSVGGGSLDESAQESDHRQGLKLEDWLLMKEKERQKRLYEQVEEANDPATHKPRISERAKKVDRPGDFVTRLYDPDYRPLVYDENAPTFHPRIHSSYDDPLEKSGLPVHERVVRRGVKHHSRIENTQGPRGRPFISNKSRAIVEEKRLRSQSVGGGESTIKAAGSATGGGGDLTMQIQAGNPNHNKLAATASASGGGLSPGSRLYEEAIEEMRRKEAREEEQRDAAKRFSYKPELSRKSLEIANEKRSGSQAAKESIYQRSKRLAKAKQEKLAAAQRKKQEEEMEECKKTPFLNHSKVSTIRSASSADTSTVDDPSFSSWLNKSNLREHNKQKKLKEARDEKMVEEQNHPFQPLVHHELPVSEDVDKAIGYEEHIKRMKEARKREEEKTDQIESGNSTPRRAGRGGGGGNRTPGNSSKPRGNRRAGSSVGRQRSTKPMTHQGVTPFSQGRHIDPHEIGALRPPVNRYDVPHSQREQFYDEYVYEEEEAGNENDGRRGGGVGGGDFYQGFTAASPARILGGGSRRSASYNEQGYHETQYANPGSPRNLNDHYRAAQTHPHHHSHAHHHSTGGTTSSSRGSQQPLPAGSGAGGGYVPSPVDYILENHQAIVRGFRRGGGQ